MIDGSPKARSSSFHPLASSKGPSHEETTQNALSMLMMGSGYSVGSLRYDGEKGCLYNSLRLQEAVFSSPLFFSLCLRSLILSLRSYLSASPFYAKWVLDDGNPATSSQLLRRNGLQFQNGPPYPGGRRLTWLTL